MATTTVPTERHVVLHDVSWGSYESLLADHVNSSALRFTYDRGELEILSRQPSKKKPTGHWPCSSRSWPKCS